MAAVDYEGRVERTLELLDETAAISEHNADLIRGFHRERVLNDIGTATQQKNLAHLKKMAEWADERPMDEMDASDIRELVQWVKERGLAASTVGTYKEVITLFFNWINGATGTEDADAVSWMRSGSAYETRTLPKDLLTPEDIHAQIEAASNDRDRALIAVLWESGARIGELIDLTVGHIENRAHGKKITIDGKTGMRRIPLVESVPHLSRWLEHHPRPTKDTPLWCKIQQGSPDDQIGYRYIRDKVLARSVERAGIEKPCNPHHYRHSRATYLAKHLTEAQLCEWFGWVQGSDVPAKYVHLSGRDIDGVYDTMHGLQPGTTDQDESVAVCPSCDSLNDPDALRCMQCGTTMDAPVDQPEPRRERSTDGDGSPFEELVALESLLRDPDVKSALRDWIQTAPP